MQIDTLPTGEQMLRLFQQARREAGGLTYHTSDSRGSDKGFPDLVDLPEHGTIAYVEFKCKGEAVSAEQQAWLDRLESAGERVYLCRPANAVSVARLLGLHGLGATLAALGCGEADVAPQGRTQAAFDADTATVPELIAELGRLDVPDGTICDAAKYGVAALRALYHDALNGRQPRRRGGER